MSTIPPAPPPPPPPPPPPSPLRVDSSPSAPISYANRHLPYLDICNWDTKYPQLWEACAKFNVCVDEAPYKYSYRAFDSIIQVGPTCGLVALSMLMNGEVTPDKILTIARHEGFTCQGEMLSCKNLVILAEKVISLAEVNLQCSLRFGGLFSEEIVEKLLNGAALLVPYDADCNHSPCLRKGHTAHWALICGVIIIKKPDNSYTSDPNNVYVLALHGKSRYLAAWRLYDLEKSNKNLIEFSPNKESDGLQYALPENGIGGENGLRNQFLTFENFERF